MGKRACSCPTDSVAGVCLRVVLSRVGAALLLPLPFGGRLLGVRQLARLVLRGLLHRSTHQNAIAAFMDRTQKHDCGSGVEADGG